MDYVSVREAAAKWGVSIRYAQRLLAAGRIAGARKYGRSWMIPADAAKPGDPRRAEERVLPRYVPCILVSAYLPMPRNGVDVVLETLGDDGLRAQYASELAYMRGDFERAKHAFAEAAENDPTFLCACTISMVAAICTNDLALYEKIADRLAALAARLAGTPDAKLAELAAALCPAVCIAPALMPKWLIDGDFSGLPQQAVAFATFLRTKYLQARGDFDKIYEISKTAITFIGPDSYTLTYMYLEMMCASACMELQRMEEGTERMRRAMASAVPNGFIAPMVEALPFFAGEMEKEFSERYPECHKAALDMWKGIWPNWVAFHNGYVNSNITTLLTLREQHIASMAIRKVPYRAIAEKERISVGRVQNIMHDIYIKLGVSNRQELSELMLWNTHEG